jgi:protein gp37
LLKVPAAVRFLSCEPLLGPVDLLRVDAAGFGGNAGHKVDCIRKGYWSKDWGFVNHCDMHDKFGDLHWVIVGGESGHGARPMHPQWASSLLSQCQAFDVPFFFKQWGEWAPRCIRRGDPNEVIYADGRHIPFDRESILAEEKRSGIPHDNRTATAIYRVGKKSAGRVLEGREWSEFPEVTHAGRN